MNEPISGKPVASQLRVSLVKIIVTSWLIVGTFDILFAIAQTLINGGKPIKMLQFIASGVFGRQAFSGGVAFAVYGLALHYFIAFIWTFLFFKVYPKLNLVAKNKILTGVVYGIIIWIVMSMIVLPLSNTPRLNFNLGKSIISALILIAAIGLPLSIIANRYFSTGGIKQSSRKLSKTELNYEMPE